MSRRSISAAFRPGIESLRASWKPLALVVTLCLATIAGYFYIPEVHRILVAGADFKDRSGLWLIALSGFIAGGFLPELARALVGTLPKTDRAWLSKTLFTGWVYALLALLVFGLYKFQAAVFGDTGSVREVVFKTLFDQLFFSPLMSIPLAVGLFKWRDAGYRLSGWKSVLTFSGYRKNVVPALVLCWSYWGPITAGLYCLPERIQFVVSAFCQGAWSLLFVFLVGLNMDPPEMVEGVDAPPAP